MTDDFIKQLENIYKKEDDNSDSFNKEKDKVIAILNAVEKEITTIYDFISPIGRGGTGIIVKLVDKQLKIPKALKFPRPKTNELIESIKTEIENLKSLKHDNIINIYALGEVSITENSVIKYYPYLLVKESKGLLNILYFRDYLKYYNWV
ncbi:hypothetical protein HY745_01025 [Candidatus Desantisbacteria bacterium]|nr:hypothetical protein [Candidatus Desantisbacteria bacterium]